MKEHNFIKELALKFFKNQFNKNIDPAECGIICIDKKPEYPIAFEIYTIRADDFMRIRIYLQLGKSDNLQPYKLEVSAPYHNLSAQDEVWVTLGTFDKYHIESGFLKETMLYHCPQQSLNILLAENGEPIYAEDGSYIVLES